MRSPISRRLSPLAAAVLLAATLPACGMAREPATAVQAAPALASAAPAKPIPDEEPAVTQEVAALLGELAAGRPQGHRFTEKAATTVLADVDQNLAPRLRECGIPVTLELLARTVDGEDRQYRYRLRCRAQPLLLDIVYNKAARVNRLQLLAE
ncbi:hypothetical protein [Pseudoduganella violacea]|uniref:Lipoprotein n=1 Tax=Pseudoduganella violacea TaxID=1715466 RepID=A0A7W5FUP5_9BURK|nr:hypothetical protein [Pseudoduganella violacea]MBB3119947.1 hypothetical protein [Pseudoduganella violacea]